MDSDCDKVFDLITRRLPAAGLDCLMIGGHAVNHYGVVRATQDIDFPDIVNLVLENKAAVDDDLKDLCRDFGTHALFQALRARIEELRHV